MRIDVFLANRADLAGGVLHTMLLTDALAKLGHDSRIVAADERPEWSPVEPAWALAGHDPERVLAGADAVITGTLGIETAGRSGAGVVAHLCAGYEPHLWPNVPERFEAVYRKPTLKLTIAPHLSATLERDLGVASVVVGTPRELRRFEPAADGEPLREPSAPLRVLTVGPELDAPYAPVPFKGIRTVLEIVARARRVAELRLVRITPKADPLTDSEQIDELHLAVPPAAMPKLVRSCDIYVGGSTAAEGLGTPAVEAACAGVASVLPAIPSFSEIPRLDEAALFYPPGDVDAAVEALLRLARDAALRERLAARGPDLGLQERFDPIQVAGRVVAAIEAYAG